MCRVGTRAFTLIELLVVILIIAVMAAVVVPAFAGYYEKTRFDAQIRRVQDYFAQARELAVKGDTTARLRFERSAHRFSIVVDPLPPQDDMPTALLTASGTDLAPTTDVAPFQISDEFRIEDFTVTGADGASGVTQSDVRFMGDGTSDGARITIKSAQGYSAQLTLSPMNGRLTVDMPDGSSR